MKKSIITSIVIAICLASCTEQERAKSFGGSASVKLAPGRKLVSVTWKQDQLWILTRTMDKDESADAYEFRENSAYGILEGVVEIEEVKP